jgi:hypothetical protein
VAMEYPDLEPSASLTMSECNEAFMRLSMANHRVWACNPTVMDADGTIASLVLPKRFPLVLMTEEQRVAAVPTLTQELVSNPHYAMVVKEFGVPYVLDWMTVWGAHYEPNESNYSGTGNFNSSAAPKLNIGILGKLGGRAVNGMSSSDRDILFLR